MHLFAYPMATRAAIKSRERAGSNNVSKKELPIYIEELHVEVLHLEQSVYRRGPWLQAARGRANDVAIKPNWTDLQPTPLWQLVVIRCLLVDNNCLLEVLSANNDQSSSQVLRCLTELLHRSQAFPLHISLRCCYHINRRAKQLLASLLMPEARNPRARCNLSSTPV